MFRKLPFALLCALLTASSASAHYLWVSIDPAAGPNGAARIFFEEGPAAGDGHYLDPILASNTTWVRTIDEPKGKRVTVSDTKKDKFRWLQTGPLEQKRPRSVDAYGKFGVYRYGKTDVLLHYYARVLDVSEHEHLHELGRAEQMALDIEPHDFGSRMTLKVLWKNEPAAGRTIYVRGPKGFRKNLKTDKEGKATFETEHNGRYLFRTNVELNEAGQDGGKDYSLIRHHATLVMNLPLEK